MAHKIATAGHQSGAERRLATPEPRWLLWSTTQSTGFVRVEKQRNGVPRAEVTAGLFAEPRMLRAALRAAGRGVQPAVPRALSYRKLFFVCAQHHHGLSSTGDLSHRYPHFVHYPRCGG